MVEHYIMRGIATKVKYKEHIDVGFMVGDTYKILYCDRQYLGIEAHIGSSQTINEMFIKNMKDFATRKEWESYIGKTISWVNRDSWSIRDDDKCGNCKSRCRSESGKCGLYEE
jgi:hypothetical protein